jgi:hypothetical protein
MLHVQRTRHFSCVRTSHAVFAPHCCGKGARGGRRSPPVSAVRSNRAVLDALAANTSFVAALNANLPGIDAALTTPRRVPAHLVACLDRRAPHCRHARPAVTPATPSDAHRLVAPHAGRSSRYGHRHFNSSYAGIGHRHRVAAIAGVLDALPDYAVTLTATSSFPILPRRRVRQLRRGGLSTGRRHVYLEQPLAREALAAPARCELPLIDESDDTYASWPAARACGYTGVSARVARGLYESIVNAMRCAQWNAARACRLLLSGERRRRQGWRYSGDLALAAALGIPSSTQCHHYVDSGFTGQIAPSERDALSPLRLFYERDGNVSVTTSCALSLRSLTGAGFAAAVPDFAQLASTRPCSYILCRGQEHRM